MDDGKQQIVELGDAGSSLFLFFEVFLRCHEMFSSKCLHFSRQDVHGKPSCATLPHGQVSRIEDVTDSEGFTDKLWLRSAASFQVIPPTLPPTQPIWMSHVNCPLQVSWSALLRGTLARLGNGGSWETESAS